MITSSKYLAWTTSSHCLLSRSPCSVPRPGVRLPHVVFPVQKSVARRLADHSSMGGTVRALRNCVAHAHFVCCRTYSQAHLYIHYVVHVGIACHRRNNLMLVFSHSVLFKCHRRRPCPCHPFCSELHRATLHSVRVARLTIPCQTIMAQHMVHIVGVPSVCFFVYIVYRDEGVVAPRLSSRRTQKTHHQCWNVCTLGATSSAQTSGEKPHLTQLRKHQRIQNVSTCCIVTIPVLVSPHCCSHSLMGEASRDLATVGKTDHKPRKNHTRNLSQPSSCTPCLRVGKLARADCTRNAQKSTARSSPHCAYYSHRRKNPPFSVPEELPSIKGRGKTDKPKLLTYDSLVADSALSP